MASRGRLEDAVQGEGQLDGAEVRAEVAAGLGDGRDDEVADLAAQLGQVGVGQASQVVGVTDPFEPHRPVTLSALVASLVGTRSACRTVRP